MMMGAVYMQKCNRTMLKYKGNMGITTHFYVKMPQRKPKTIILVHGYCW